MGWAIPWPSLHEFLAIVAHPRIYRPPTPLALRQADAWLESPTLALLAESTTHWSGLRARLSAGRVAGALIQRRAGCGAVSAAWRARAVVGRPGLQPFFRVPGREPSRPSEFGVIAFLMR